MIKATLVGLGVLLAGLIAASAAQAQNCYYPVPQAPDMRGGGFYCQNYCGAWYGPNYCVYPPFAPFQGMVPGPPPGNGMGGQFPSHPFARSPRDFFMWDGK